MDSGNLNVAPIRKSGAGSVWAGVSPCYCVFTFKRPLELKAVKKSLTCKCTSSSAFLSSDLGAQPCPSVKLFYHHEKVHFISSK